jgi:hypothetical protein
MVPTMSLSLLIPIEKYILAKSRLTLRLMGMILANRSNYLKYMRYHMSLKP